jgi:hypothetical protein
MAKKFFYVCGGLMMLAFAYHFGAASATAQIAGNQVVAAAGANSGSTPVFYVFAANGDAYVRNGTGWTLSGNVFGGPVPAQQESWGQVKARYR